MRTKVAPMVGAIAVLAVAQGVMQQSVIMPKWKKDYSTNLAMSAEGLSPDQVFASFVGFRELIAGILWVQADSYFDSGNYDAVLPLIRLTTMLDPHQIDVYATGTWHMAYNFTDESGRSDRRYIPSALALIKEGATNNPETYELYFETGWTWYHKVDDDYPQAVKWMEKAVTKGDMLPARRNLLTNIYLRNGQLDKAREYLGTLLDRAKENKKTDKSFSANTNIDTIDQNLDAHLIRMAQRGEFAKTSGQQNSHVYDTQPPFDVKFGIKVSVVAERVLQAEGNWGVQTLGTRLRLVLRDEDYPNGIPAGVDWDKGKAVELTPPKGLTFMQEQLFIRDMRFDKKIDMGRDPTMYPLAKPKYLLEVYYNPRSAPAHIQDRFGWSGEGMTDKNYLNTEIRPGQRVLYCRFEVTRDQLLRRNEWARKTPVFISNGYVERSADEVKGIIRIPGFEDAPAVDPNAKGREPVVPSTHNH